MSIKFNNFTTEQMGNLILEGLKETIKSNLSKTLDEYWRETKKEIIEKAMEDVVKYIVSVESFDNYKDLNYTIIVNTKE